MPQITQSVLTLAVIFFLLLVSARAQTSSVEVPTGSNQARFAAPGDAQEMRVEVFSPGGEMVFDSGTVTGQVVEWNMQDQRGRHVPDGVYLAAISTMSRAGKVRKRVEQITVARELGNGAQTHSPSAAQATITGSGTPNQIAKFDGTDTITDSLMTEVTSNIGIGTETPTSKLHIHVLQPPAVADDGDDAKNLLQTSGGKGGDTTSAGRTAGQGTSISLLAGNGGDAVAGATRGTGGSITIQPGGVGGGAGTGGSDGNVLIAPTAVGNVGVGTNGPASKLTVAGGDIQITTAGRGIKFADGSTQTTAAITSTEHDGTLSGEGTAGSPLSVAVPLTLSGSRNGAILRVENTGSGPAIFAYGVIDATHHYNIDGERVLGVSGVENTFVGISAGAATTGAGNSFFGDRSGETNTTGVSNAFFGDRAGADNTTGYYNSFFGYVAGANNTTGYMNAFFGHYAGVYTTTGYKNAFFGQEAGSSNTTGRENSFFGHVAGTVNTTGHDNSFFGQDSGNSNTSGSNNSFFGASAGGANTTGQFNTVIGALAGNNAISTPMGSNNTLIGYNAEAASGISNSTAIGANALVSASNTMMLGTNVVVVQVPGKLQVDTLGAAGSQDLCRNGQNRLATCSSSLRYKTAVQSYLSGVEVIKRLRPISFRWRGQGGRDVGLAAEEVAAVEPLLVTSNEEGVVEGVKYGQLNVLLINAVKEQQRQIEQLRSEVAQLQRTVKQQRAFGKRTVRGRALDRH